MTDKPKAFKIEGDAFNKILPIYRAGLEFARSAAKEAEDLRERQEAECTRHHNALWDALNEAVGGNIIKNGNFHFSDEGQEAGVFLVIECDRQKNNPLEHLLRSLGASVVDAHDLEMPQRTPVKEPTKH